MNPATRTPTPHVLVTGGAGYIGSHACRALEAAGFTPVVYDNLSQGFKAAVTGPFIKADVRDATALHNALQTYNPVAVLHFAALIWVGESVKDPASYYHNNTVGTFTLLNALKEHATTTGQSPLPVVFSSTAAVYGIPEDTTSPIAEDTAKKPINPYGHSKLISEQMLADFSTAYAQRHVILRYFNAAGAHPEGLAGSRLKDSLHLIPQAMNAVLGARPPLELMGTDYPTPDGTAVRDYIHVTDLAEAHVSALKYLLKGGESTALNLGTGQGFSVRQVLDVVSEVLGSPVPVVEKPRRAGDPPVLVANSHKAQTLLNWQPKLSDLPTIVRTAWAWRQKIESE